MLGAFALYKRFEPYKESKETLQELLNLLYDFFGKKIAQAMKQGQHEISQSWFNAIQAITHTKKILSQNGNTQLAIELMLVKMSMKEGTTQ